jgi:CelD/BcsL family acetyltransferase involved in cellulose biosynthesis
MIGQRSAQHAMPVEGPRRATGGPVLTPNIARVAVSRSLRDFAAWWPRSGDRGEGRCYAFQYAEILEVWCDTIGEANRIEPVFVAIFGASGSPALLLPFGIQARNGVRVLRFMDDGVSDYNAPVVFPEAASWGPEAGAAIWDQLRRALPPFDLAMLEKMPGVVADLINPLCGLATAPHLESCHVAKLEGDWASFEPEHVVNRADSRRRLRKLERLGDARFEIATTPEQSQDFLLAMMRMKREKFIETKGYDVFTEGGFGAFYREATRRLGVDGPVQVSALLLDDQILAAHWGYVAADRFYYLMPAHEAGEWRHYAPGRLLNEWLLKWALERGLKYFDFGIGDEAYKFNYCDLDVPLHDAILPVNAKGRLFAALLELKRNTKRSLRNSLLAPALIATRNFLRGLHPSKP